MMSTSYETPKELAILGGLLGFAATLRFWNLTDLGLTHFDEGSYAMTARWLATFGSEGWIYQSGHAPGLFPTVVGLFFVLFGISDYVAISVSAVAGSLTVALLYLIGKNWFDRNVGWAAALFLAVAEYHLIYSRLALTDCLFTLFFWAALACFYRGIQTESRMWYLLGGLVTGLCWNTKYHGFFPLLIVGAWLSGSYFVARRSEAGARPNSDDFSSFGYSVVAAGLVYLPWAVFVQISVGYSTILNEQLGYVFGGDFPRTSLAVVFFYLSRWLPFALLLMAGIGTLLVFARRRRVEGFLLLSTGLFTCATLFYASFPRLLLPVIPGVCLLSALALKTVVNKFKKYKTVGVAGAVLAIVILSFLRAHWLLSFPTNAYRLAAQHLQNETGLVITQMSKNFYFYEREPSVEMRRTHLDELNALLQANPNAIIAVDPILQRFPKYHEWFRRQQSQLGLVAEFDIDMYDPVYYQGFDPRRGWDDVPASFAPFRPGEAKIEIYRATGDQLTGSENGF